MMTFFYETGTILVKDRAVHLEPFVNQTLQKLNQFKLKIN